MFHVLFLTRSSLSEQHIVGISPRATTILLLSGCPGCLAFEASSMCVASYSKVIAWDTALNHLVFFFLLIGGMPCFSHRQPHNLFTAECSCQPSGNAKRLQCHSDLLLRETPVLQSCSCASLLYILRCHFGTGTTCCFAFFPSHMLGGICCLSFCPTIPILLQYPKPSETLLWRGVLPAREPCGGTSRQGEPMPGCLLTEKRWALGPFVPVPVSFCKVDRLQRPVWLSHGCEHESIWALFIQIPVQSVWPYPVRLYLQSQGQQRMG